MENITPRKPMDEVERPYYARTGKSAPIPHRKARSLSTVPRTVPTNRHRSGQGPYRWRASLHRHWPQAERSGRRSTAANSPAPAQSLACRRRRVRSRAPRRRRLRPPRLRVAPRPPLLCWRGGLRIWCGL